MGLAANLMTHTVTIASQTGKDSAGDPSFGSQSTIRARVEHKIAKVRSNQGEIIQAQHRVISESQILDTDRVWLPGDSTGDNNQARKPVMTGHADTPSGYVLYEAWF